MEPQFAALRLRSADGTTLYGPFTDRDDADLASRRIADDLDAFGCTVALYPPDADPITTCATAEATGTVLELVDHFADAMIAARTPDLDTDIAGPVAVSVLVDPPARRLLLWIGPFPDTAEAQNWMDQAGTATGSYRATMRLHPLLAMHVSDSGPEPESAATGAVA
ncbi:hypothetical protein [Actinokineospora sp. NPDC004072]